MKTPLWALAATFVTLPFSLPAVQTGDTLEAVEAELGTPTGSAAVGERTILFFARGEVHMRDNRVTTVNLVSETELAAREAAAVAASERMEAAAQARIARLAAEGSAVHAAKKRDAVFAAMSATAQLSYWHSFATRYPMIPISAEIEPLLARVDHELRLREIEVANQARLAALEERVEDAVARAERAEREARSNRSSGYGYVGQPYRQGYGRPRPYYEGPHAPKRQPVVRPSATPPQNPVDAARSEAMAEIEAARQRAYAGGGQ